MVVAEKEQKQLTICFPIPHPKQREFMESRAKRKVVRAGRRGGKTKGCAMMAVRAFLKGRRVLYTAPTSEQTDAFWFEVQNILAPLLKMPIIKVNAQERYIERIGTKNRLKAKTAWNADSMRGDYADLLIYDEFQLTNEDAWEVIGAPMLMDNNGDAVFVYTPPSLRSSGVSKARDPRHAAKLFKAAQADTTGRWQAFHFTSHDNPHISQDALRDLLASGEMSKQSYRQEILAEDDEIQMTWLVYGSFNESICKMARFDLPKNWPRYVFHDFGTANPAAVVVCQNPGTADFIVEREYFPGGGRAIHDRVEDLKRLTCGTPVLGRIGGNHAEDEIRQAYGAHGWPISEPKINSVKLQIDRVRAMMDLNKIKVFNDCTRVLEELMSCLFKPDLDGHPTDDIDNEKNYHMMACFRYGFSDFRPETVTRGFTPVSIPKWRM